MNMIFFPLASTRVFSTLALYVFFFSKNMSFLIKNDMCLNEYSEIWDKIKETLNIKFDSMPVYDEKYINAKVR